MDTFFKGSSGHLKENTKNQDIENILRKFERIRGNRDNLEPTDLRAAVVAPPGGECDCDCCTVWVRAAVFRAREVGPRRPGGVCVVVQAVLRVVVPALGRGTAPPPWGSHRKGRTGARTWDTSVEAACRSVHPENTIQYNKLIFRQKIQ